MAIKSLFSVTHVNQTNMQIITEFKVIWIRNKLPKMSPTSMPLSCGEICKIGKQKDCLILDTFLIFKISSQLRHLVTTGTEMCLLKTLSVLFSDVNTQLLCFGNSNEESWTIYKHTIFVGYRLILFPEGMPGSTELSHHLHPAPLSTNLQEG